MALYKYPSENKSSNQPLSSNLFTELQTDILTGKIRSGQKLTEQSICDQYKVSRTPVREALRQLEMDGLIENIPNRGAYVIGFSKQDVLDMYDLRKVYEVQAVKWAIERITDEELDQLEETFEFMEFYTMKKDTEKMLNINTGFHQLIYSASHNRMLQHMLASYQVYLKHLRDIPVHGNSSKQNSDGSCDDYLAIVLNEHRAIFQAFRDKDIESGAQAMEIHMENSKLRSTT